MVAWVKTSVIAWHLVLWHVHEGPCLQLGVKHKLADYRVWELLKVGMDQGLGSLVRVEDPS